MADVLFVSKPVVPPWNDSSKNLVRDLALGLRRYRPVVLGREGSEPLPVGQTEPLYPASAGGFAPGLRDNARVFGRLVGGPRPALWHFFFAPNPKSSAAGRLARALRRVPTVHTVCSAPRPGTRLPTVLFADCTVVLSRHSEARFLAEGVPAERLRRIPPAIEPLAPLAAEERVAARETHDLPPGRPLLTFPGDLEFGEGARLALHALPALADRDALLVMACRAKTAGAREAEASLRDEAARLGVTERERWIGETPRIHALLGASDVVLLPSIDLYAKMDYPLVLLEAMSLAIPTVVAAGSPAAELAVDGGALAVEARGEALAAALDGLLGDDGARRALGEAGRGAVLERHARGPMAAAYEDLYDTLRR